MTPTSEKCEPVPIAVVSDEVRDRMLARAKIQDADYARQEAEAAERQKLQCWGRFISARGSRYQECRFGNFKTETVEQASAVLSLQDYCSHLQENIAMGRGMILFGPRGTGKDHLVVAMAHAACENGYAVSWLNGLDLYGRVRDAMDSASESEREIIREFASFPILYISDPIPPVGKLTEFQIGTLFRIIDRRYNNCKPTWTTVNVSSGAELDDRIGAQNGDRLRDGALTIFTNWSSYRKPQ